MKTKRIFLYYAFVVVFTNQPVKQTMAAHRDRRKPKPPENIVTESDLQMKEQLRKQIDTNVTLDSQLSQVKSFMKGQVYASTTDSLTGQVSLEEFSRLLKEQEKTDELRQFGLSDDEISLKLKHEQLIHSQALCATDSPCISDLKSDNKKLKVIEQKVAYKAQLLSQPTTFAGAKQLTRHEMDLEKAVTRDRNPSKVFRCLVTHKSVESEDPDHPINHLDQIWKDVLTSKPTCRNRKRKRKRATSTIADGSEMSTNVDSNNVSEETIPKLCCRQEEVPSSLSVDCSEHRKSNIEPVPFEVIERYRLSVEQIKELPRFQNYDVGTPSPTLYLKNLSPRVTEEDLVSLFVHFQKSHATPIVYRLLHGRMKGQAFVTFDSVETATAAMNLVNGYDFKGKPVIIAYGKKCQAASEVSDSTTDNLLNITSSCLVSSASE